MPRYVAFLRGVSPQNCTMPALHACFESAGFGAVRTVLGTGNVVFDTRASSIPALEKKVERAIATSLDRPFCAIVRAVEHLQSLLASDPFARFALPVEARSVITFLRQPPDTIPDLPVERDGARILALRGAEAFTAYVPGPRGPAFMGLLERTFGKDITTRRCVR